MPTYDPDTLIDIHEDRIQRLENEHQDVSIKVAALSERIDAGFDRLTDKIENCISPLAEKMSNHMDDDKEMNQRLEIGLNHHNELNQRLLRLEDTTTRHAIKASTVKKAGWSVVLVVLGAFAKFFFDVILK